MSAADNTSNFSSNPTDVYEDELLTWLQYPVDDAFERNYCSDALGGVLPLPKAVVAKTRSDAQPQAGYLSDMGLDPCTGSGSSRLMPIKANVGSGPKSANVGSGPKSFSRPSSNAENALALGAARAAGHSSPVGHDAFTKVRTSMQLQAIKTTACASFKAFDHKDCPVLTPKIPAQNASKQAHMPNSLSSMWKSKNAPSGSISPATEKSGKVWETHSQQLTHTQQSRLKHVAEEESNGRVYGKHAISRRSAKENGAMATSSNSFNVRVKAGWSDQTSETFPSSSGGSQTSMSLSFMETSYSGKRTHEVSELQSEDTDDKMRDVKVPRNSTSRRNRISQVHNLSERNRRNKINEKLQALQDLIPNSSKTDKASVLDEAIEYMKTLQLQLQMVSTRSSMNTNMTSMMVPMGFPPTPMYMAPFHSIGLGVPIGPLGLGMGSGMGINTPMGLLPQCGGAAPFQPAPSAMTQYGMPLDHGTTAHIHDSSQAFMNPGLLPTHLSASMQMTREPSDHVLFRSLSSSYAHQCQQQERGQHLGFSFLDHENEQQDALSD